MVRPERSAAQVVFPPVSGPVVRGTGVQTAGLAMNTDEAGELKLIGTPRSTLTLRTGAFSAKAGTPAVSRTGSNRRRMKRKRIIMYLYLSGPLESGFAGGFAAHDLNFLQKTVVTAGHRKCLAYVAIPCMRVRWYEVSGP